MRPASGNCHDLRGDITADIKSLLRTSKSHLVWIGERECVNTGLVQSSESRFSPWALGRVALAVAHQGSHRPVRARIRAYGSSADRFAIPEGSP